MAKISYVRKRKHFYKRRRYTSKKRHYRRRSTIPYSMVVKLVYQQDFKLTLPGTGTAVTKVFSLNGIYDTDQSIGGHQPRGFDQWLGSGEDGSGFYKHFVVLGTKVSCQIGNRTTEPIRANIAVMDTATALTNQNDYMERSNSRTKIVGTESGDNFNRPITMKWSAKRWFGKQNVTDEKDLQGSASSNPAEEAYVHINVSDAPFAANGTGNIDCMAKLEFIVLLQSPLTPAQS